LLGVLRQPGCRKGSQRERSDDRSWIERAGVTLSQPGADLESRKLGVVDLNVDPR
jgi:hypothetical protein